jgi:replicative DNA helicase
VQEPLPKSYNTLMAYKFQESIQRGIIYLAKSDESFLLQLMPMIKEEYFEFPSHQKLYTVLVQFFLAYKKLPTDDLLLEEVKKVMTSNELFGDYRDELEFINGLDEKSIDNQEYYLDLVEEFAKEQAVKDAIIRSVEHLKKKNFEAIEEEVRSAFSVNRNVDLGTDYFSDIRERWERLNTESLEPKFRTPFETLNEALEGGMAHKEMAMVVAPPGVGKSLFLANQAARSILDGHDVLYITLEMAEDRVAQRLDSIFTRIQQKDLSNRVDDIEERLNIISKQWENRGKLVIKEFPTKRLSMTGLRAFLNQLKNYEDFSPDIIVVDYLELMKTEKDMAEYQGQERLAQELRGIASEYGTLVWTATQTNREGKKVNIITDAELADSYGKIRVCDLVFSINQTEQEFDQGNARLYLMKSRNGRARFIVPIGIDYSRLVVSQRNLNDTEEEQTA